MKEKVIIVTGASRGMGAAMVSQLSGLGCKILAVARDGESLRSLWEHDPNVHWMVQDLSEAVEATRLVEIAVETFGRIDGLINNAGVIEPIARLSDCSPESWAAAVSVNLTAPALLIGAALPYLEKSRGRVVNISSGAAVKVVQGWSAYCSSKAGLLHLTNNLAAEYPGVAFFSLRPGVIDTQMQEEIRRSEGMTPTDLEKFRHLKSDHKLEPPEVPARAAVWLVLQGPLDRSGEFIEYTDEGVQSGVSAIFSETAQKATTRQEGSR